MSLELRIIGPTAGTTVRAVISRDSDEKVWSVSTSAWVTRVNADYATYGVTMTETPASSTIFLGDMPSGIATGTRCHVDYYDAGATLTFNDVLLGGEDIYPDGTSPAAASSDMLASLAEFKTIRAISGNDDDDKYTMLLQMATSAIEDLCNTRFTANTLTEFYDGSGFNYLKLRSAPASITSLTMNPYGTPEVITVGDLAWTAGSYLYFKPSATLHSGFSEGYQNFKVIYESLASAPWALKMACILVAAAMETKSDTDISVTEKSIGDVKIKYDFAFADSTDPIYSDAMSLLRPYMAIPAF